MNGAVIINYTNEVAPTTLKAFGMTVGSPAEQFAVMFFGILLMFAIAVLAIGYFAMWYERQGFDRTKTQGEKPIKYPDALGIRKDKKGYYILKNRKKNYLSQSQIDSKYARYILTLKLKMSDYPTRVITL